MKFRWLVGILVVLGLGLVAVGAVIWYQAATLKSRVAESLGNALGAQVDVTSLSIDLWKGELRAAGITLTNRRADAPWDKGEISQAVAHFHLRDLFAPTLPIRVEVNSWKLGLHPSSAAADSSAPVSGGASSAPAGGSRRGIEVTELSATQGDVEIDLSGGGAVLLHGVAFDSNSNGAQVWTTQLRAESINAGSLVVGSSSVELRSEPDKITFTNLRMQCADGAITGDGARDLNSPHAAKATLKAIDVPVIMLVAVKWQMKLAGLASGTLNYQGDDTGAQAQGQVSIAHGKFNIVPFLGKMAATVGLPDISGMEVDKATTDFTWKNHVLHLANIDVRKNDWTRIAGEVDIGADEQVDGRLKLGLPDSILARWPQLQANVFSVPLEGYGWADVHLTGTPDHLQEDLSSRVLAAGIQGGSGLINQGTQKAMDLLKGLISP